MPVANPNGSLTYAKLHQRLTWDLTFLSNLSTKKQTDRIVHTQNEGVQTKKKKKEVYKTLKNNEREGQKKVNTNCTTNRGGFTTWTHLFLHRSLQLENFDFQSPVRTQKKPAEVSIAGYVLVHIFNAEETKWTTVIRRMESPGTFLMFVYES